MPAARAFVLFLSEPCWPDRSIGREKNAKQCNVADGLLLPLLLPLHHFSVRILHRLGIGVGSGEVLRRLWGSSGDGLTVCIETYPSRPNIP